MVDKKVVDSRRSREDLEDFMKLTEDQSTIHNIRLIFIYGIITYELQNVYEVKISLKYPSEYIRHSTNRRGRSIYLKRKKIINIQPLYLSSV